MEAEGSNMPSSMPGALSQTGIVNSAAGAAGALASWAIASIGGKVSVSIMLLLLGVDGLLSLHPMIYKARFLAIPNHHRYLL